MTAKPERGEAFRRLLGGRLTPVTTWLLVVELCAFIVYAFAGGPAWYRDHLALNPVRALRGLELWQLVTAPWFHVAGGALLGNLIGLFFIGPLVERPWGSRRFFTLFVVAAVIGNLAAALTGLALPPRQPIGGCGPALVALIVAFGFIYRRQQLLFFGVAPMRAVHLAVFFTGLVLLMTLLSGDIPSLAASVAAGVVGALAATERLRVDLMTDGLAAWWRRARRARLKRRYKVLSGGLDEKGHDEPKRYLN